MYRWQTSHKVQSARKAECDNIERIVKSLRAKKDTFIKPPPEEILAYIAEKFPEVDVSKVPIYICNHADMAKVGFAHMGGCYIHHLGLILVARFITANKSSRNKFERLMKKYQATATTTDIIVHELFHAASAKMERSSRKGVHMEEHFVYSNCIDFYKRKGMSEDDIINNNFLPFFIEDVFTLRGEMQKIIRSLSDDGINVDDYYADKESQRKFTSRNAEVLVEKIVSRARKMGHRMIKLHNDPKGDDVADSFQSWNMRFAGLDFS